MRYLWLVASASVLTGCGSPLPTDDVSQSSAALSPSPNDQAAFDFFIGKGLTNIQAAGIVGNLDQESQMDPGAVQSGGPGRGIAQWSIGGRWDTDTNDNVLWYAGTQGESSGSLTLQLEFIWYELQTFSSYGLASLRATTNVTDATIAFETDFEGCGECDQSTRISYAEAALAAYGSFDYGASYVSQSFPLASTALTMTAGGSLASYIELKNTGTKAWDTNTHLATSNPRDRVSVFAASTWLAPDRPTGVSGSVATGDSYKFKFDLHAPAKEGKYFEYFNLVEEGVAWFSDPGQGGPPDTDLEVQIVVVAAPKVPPSPPADGGTSANSHDDGGAAGMGDDDGGEGSAVPVGAGATEQSDGGGAQVNPTSSNEASEAAAACAITTRGSAAPSMAWGYGLIPLGLVARRRSRRPR